MTIERVEGHGFWSWAMPLGRFAGIRFFLHWTAIVTVLFGLSAMAKVAFEYGGFAWFLLPVGVAIPLFSLAFHALAHIGIARAIGGGISECQLWCLGERCDYQLPLRPAPQIAVAAAGPVASLILWLGAAFWIHQSTPGPIGQAVLGQIEYLNFLLFFFNLLTIPFFDGARMWRGVLWPILGLRQAVVACVWLGYAAGLILGLYGIYAESFMMVMFAAMCIFAVALDHRAVREGYDPTLEVETAFAGGRSGSGWWSKWRAERERMAHERSSRLEQEERELLDRLLAKVSEHGLPSLTARERAQLQAISKHQRERETSS